jgi:hypothetical protein
MLNLFGIQEKEIIPEEQELEVKVTIFDYLKDIMINKKGDVTAKDPSMSKFNTFMIIRFLSLDDGYLPFLNVVNTFQDNLTKEEAYKMLLLTIPKSRKFLKFPKKIENYAINSEELAMLSMYFVCAEHEVSEFIRLKLLDNNDIRKIKMMYGGRHG